MTETSLVPPPVLDANYKKKLQAKFVLGQEDEFYLVSKSGKGLYCYQL
jgi:hypothetical protein